MELSPAWVGAGATVLLGAGGAAANWVSGQIGAVKATQKLLFEKHDTLSKELADYKLHVAEKYVSREALKETLAPLTDSINRLANRIDGGHGN